MTHCEDTDAYRQGYHSAADGGNVLIWLSSTPEDFQQCYRRGRDKILEEATHA